MRTAMRPRYYCDYCNKGSGSPSAMRRHESGCTLNPHRVCRMCSLAGVASPSRDELVLIMDTDGFKAMCEYANHCPACILSALRTKNIFDDEKGHCVSGPQDGRESWSYSEAKKSWWADFNNAERERWMDY